MTRLENWSYHVQADLYTAPEDLVTCLVGEVYGYKDPIRHPDGKRVRTSRIVGCEGDCVVTSRGSKYELGVVDPDYEAAFPNAKERLLNSLKKS
jgi:hypothetical protein